LGQLSLRARLGSAMQIRKIREVSQPSLNSREMARSRLAVGGGGKCSIAGRCDTIELMRHLLKRLLQNRKIAA
jgi:hypothetical protein